MYDPQYNVRTSSDTIDIRTRLLPFAEEVALEVLTSKSLLIHFVDVINSLT